ncbi:hypothetical protein ACFE04_017771 [Oxalis oulophora]
MFEEAASLATSILNQIKYNEQLYDALESVGMVLVQSLKELGRSSQILNDLKALHPSVAVIPSQVLLTGAALLISESLYSGVPEFLEEFLSKWTLVDGHHYVLVDNAETKEGPNILEVEQYMDVVEVYAVTLLGTVLNNVDLAVSWVEKAEIPQENRQKLLRRLESLHSLKASKSALQQSVDTHESSLSLEELKASETLLKALKINSLHNGDSDERQRILKLSQRVEPCFWWFRTSTLRFGSFRFVISNGKVVLGFLFLLISYVLQRKRAALVRIAKTRAVSIKKALLDLWGLAFSFQVNPLATVQSIPSTTGGPR